MPGQSEGRIGLSDFLADLRTEPSEAQARAEDDELKLAVGEVNLSLDVTYTLSGDAEVAGKVKAKF
ncbi:trypco2 family protein [Streptomyces chartreusis]